MITDAMIVWMRDFDWTVKQRKKKGKNGYHRTAGKRLRETHAKGDWEIRKRDETLMTMTNFFSYQKP